MDKNKIIILALILVIAALLVCVVSMMPNSDKHDTKLTFKSNSTLAEGGTLKIKLADVNGTAISNQTVNVTITNQDKSSDYHSVLTNEKGIGSLKFDKDAGKYNVSISYGGNDKYNGCNATKKVTIEEAVEEQVVEEQVAEEPVTQQSTESSGSSNDISYDEEINVYYDSNGIIVDPDGQHPQGVGSSYSDARDARDRWERGEPVMV